MDYIWTPWRYRYIAEAGKSSGCIFCDAPDPLNRLCIHIAAGLQGSIGTRLIYVATSITA